MPRVDMAKVAIQTGIKYLSIAWLSLFSFFIVSAFWFVDNSIQI